MYLYNLAEMSSYIMACIHLPLEVFPDGSYKPINESANIIFEKCDELPASSNLPSINLTEILSGFGAKPLSETTEEKPRETTEENPCETAEENPCETTEENPRETTEENPREEPEIRVYVDPNKKRHHSRNLTFRKSKPIHNHTRKHYD
jgi:hypothetical protein